MTYTCDPTCEFCEAPLPHSGGVDTCNSCFDHLELLHNNGECHSRCPFEHEEDLERDEDVKESE